MTNHEKAPKLLFLSQGLTIDNHPGWQDALERLKSEGEILDFENIPHLGYAKEHGWPAFYEHVIKKCSDSFYDIVYFHYFHRKGDPSPAECIREIKRISPETIVITSSGDPFSDNWMKPDYPQNFKDASRYADLVFSTQMGNAADKMIRWGARNVVLAPNSMCQKRFSAGRIDPANHQFDFDVVFIGSRNGGGRNPFNRNFYEAGKRLKLVKRLSKAFGKRFGLFGKGWDGYLPNQGPAPFDKQQEYFRRGRVVVGGNPYSHSDYYSSNRLFFEVASGIPTVELSVPRLDKIFRDQDQVYFCEDIDSIVDCCRDLLKKDPVELYAKSAAAAQEVAARHTQYHRFKFKIEYALAFRANGWKLPDMKLPFFLPEVDWEDEKKYAIRSNDK